MSSLSVLGFRCYALRLLKHLQHEVGGWVNIAAVSHCRNMTLCLCDDSAHTMLLASVTVEQRGIDVLGKITRRPHVEHVW